MKQFFDDYTGTVLTPRGGVRFENGILIKQRTMEKENKTEDYMKYGIQSMDSGCDYTVLDTLEDCKEWVLSNLYELERDGARYIQIVNADHPDDVVFYSNVKWDNGTSNLKEIAEVIVK